MNHQDYNSLLSALNEAVAILARNRTPDPTSVAAYDTLKQARAMILTSIERPAVASLAEPLAA